MAITAPWTLRAAAAIVAVEAAGLAALTILELAAFSPDRPGVALGVAMLFALGAAGLAFAALHLLRANARARAPVIVAQIFAILVASTLSEPGTAEVLHPVAPVLMGLAIAVIVLVLAGPSRRAMSSH